MTSTVTIFVTTATGYKERGVQNQEFCHKLNILINIGSRYKEEKGAKFEFRFLVFVCEHCAFEVDHTACMIWAVSASQS